MMPVLKAEFRKLLSVRSTYIITILLIAFVIFIGFYVEGWRLTSSDGLLSPTQLSSDVYGALSLSVFGAIVAILLATHEYRYNTIMYTLTNSNSRSKVLLSKFIVISCYAVVLTAIIAILSPLATALGVQAHGHALVPQVLHYKDLIWRSLFYGWSYGVAGLLLAILLRNQIGAIVALFVLPSAIEPLIGQLLNRNVVYLPFTAQAQVIGQSSPVHGYSISPGKGALVFGIYLLVGWLVAWYLFLKRDAN